MPHAAIPRLAAAFPAGEFYCPPAEVLATEGASEKHLRDIASIVRLSGDDLNVPTLERLCAERGLLEAWHDVRNRAD